MNPEELKNTILELCTEAAFEENTEFLTVFIPKEKFHDMMILIRNKSGLEFDYLFCMTCIDWKEHLIITYHLMSKKHNNNTLVVKVKLTDTINPEIESVTDLWKSAELQEDEVYDFFGVKFLNHPNLRRLFLDENWNGFPLRKNYEDVNMIKL